MQRKYFRVRDLVSTPGSDDKPATEGRYPVSGATIWRWVASGKFPKPVKLAGGTTAWPVELIEKWERERSGASSDAKSPVKAGARGRRGTISGGAL